MTFIACTPKELPTSQLVAAAAKAIEINPLNAPMIPGAAMAALPAFELISEPYRIAVMTSKYWGRDLKTLTVGFMEPIQQDLKDMILYHLNLLGMDDSGKRFSNVKFEWVARDPMVRITREADGYWSYLGTDILSIAKTQPTMCLQGFTMSTAVRERKRVIPHEGGHTLGFPHEHLRREVVERIDPAKAIQYFRLMGWNEATTRSNVLTPIDERSIRGTPVEEDSIMCYQLPGSITTDGKPVVGGADLTPTDRRFIGEIYPVGDTPVDPPGGKTSIVIETTGKVTAAKIVRNAPAAPTIDPSRFTLEDVVAIIEILTKLLGGRKPEEGGTSRITLETAASVPDITVVKVD